MRRTRCAALGLGVRSLMLLGWLGCVAFAGGCGDDASDDLANDDGGTRSGPNSGEPSGAEASGPHTGGPGGSATETNVAPIRDAGGEQSCEDADDCDAGS